MRKIYKYIFLSVIIAGLYSCQEVIKPEQPKPSEPKPPYEKPIEEYCYHTKITALSDTEWSLGDVLKIVKIEDNNTINTMITLS